eukprot:4443316-Amphidinium_carterae.2
MAFCIGPNSATDLTSLPSTKRRWKPLHKNRQEWQTRQFVCATILECAGRQPSEPKLQGQISTDEPPRVVHGASASNYLKYTLDTLRTKLASVMGRHTHPTKITLMSPMCVLLTTAIRLPTLIHLPKLTRLPVATCL